MTTETIKHTAGTWTAWQTGDGEWAVDATGAVTVARMNDLGGETTANARLIASAPDLLECLELALQDCEQLSAPPRSLDIYREAIRKARGQ